MRKNKKFKTIFDNLEEAVIIIKESDNQIKYANHQFFEEFEHQILNYFVNDQNAEYEYSKIKKFFNFIIKCFKLFKK